jgi:hypothetical protein
MADFVMIPLPVCSHIVGEYTPGFLLVAGAWLWATGNSPPMTKIPFDFKGDDSYNDIRLERVAVTMVWNSTEQFI